MYMHGAILSLDETLLRAVLAIPHPPALQAVMQAASYAGIGGAVWVAAGLALTLGGAVRWPGFLRLIVAIALVHLVVDGMIKPLVGRQRPPIGIAGLVVGTDVPPSPSFPSGHAANAIAAAIVLGRTWPRGRRVTWAAAAVVAAARVYLGVHYPLDALAGAGVGWVCGWIAVREPPRALNRCSTRSRA